MISKEDQVDNSLRVAYEKAAQVLRGADPEKVSARTGAAFASERYTVSFVGTPHEIQMPGVEFLQSKAPLIVKVLILHYLTSQDVHALKGVYVAFSGLPGGMFYFRSFQQRALEKLLLRFGDRPEELEEAGQSLGGQKWTAGDCSTIVPVLPMIDLVFQIYRGDDEFPAEANILFPDSTVNYLPIEDAAFLGGYLVGFLARAGR